MAVPDFQSLMLPLMEFAADGQEHSLRETRDFLAKALGVTDEERKELLPSGRQAVFDNRVAWAKTYLQQAGLLTSTRRGYFKITERGLGVLAEKPARIEIRFLDRYPEFVEFHTSSPKKNGSAPEESAESSDNVTPEEMLESAHQQIRNDLAADLLLRIKAGPPSFFEQLVVELLVKMGYGGSRKEAGKALGKSGDGGIDGIINEDRLGLASTSRPSAGGERWDGQRSKSSSAPCTASVPARGCSSRPAATQPKPGTTFPTSTPRWC
jgi:restriction system protein